MTVIASLFEHQDFTGVANTFVANTNNRYRGVRLGNLANKVTSLRATSSDGMHGNTYGFTGRDFDGRFACLNMPEGWTSWYSHVGPLNDDIESALLVNRDREEATLEATTWIPGAFSRELERLLAGRPVSAVGEPVISGVFFPSYDPDKVFLRVKQNLDVRVDVGSEIEIFGIQVVPDDLIIDHYACYIAYDIFLDLASITRLRARVHWVTTWVESGLFSQDVFNELHPQAMAGAAQMDEALNALGDLSKAISSIRRRFFAQPYVLPGSTPAMPPPNANFGRLGDSNEGATIVLPLRSLVYTKFNAGKSAAIGP